MNSLGEEALYNLFIDPWRLPISVHKPAVKDLKMYWWSTERCEPEIIRPQEHIEKPIEKLARLFILSPSRDIAGCGAPATVRYR